MTLNDLTKDSEKSLVSAFSHPMTAATLSGVFLVCGVLLIGWPREDIRALIAENRAPLLFFQVFSASLAVLCYINFRCGRGEMVKSDFAAAFYPETATHEKERSFFRYTLPTFGLHIGFLALPHLPVWFLAASVSGMSHTAWVAAAGLVLIVSLLFRLFGFTLYLLWGRQSYAGYFLARITAILYLFGTGIIAPSQNPFRLYHELNTGEPDVPEAFLLHAAVLCSACVVLGAANRFLVSRHRQTEVAP